MLVTTLASDPSTQEDSSLRPSDASGESYILQCQYCDWSTLDIDLRFAKPTKITEQLAKARKTKLSSHEDAFASLTAFYKEQLSESADVQNTYSNSPYSSPANLARIMSLYGGLSHQTLKKSREKPRPMREAAGQAEGLHAYTLDDTDDDVIPEMRTLGWEGTSSANQRLAAPSNNDARFTHHLWPVATPLRTRRGKRCKTCRQFLARPDTKVANLRYKIRLLAVNSIPRLSITPLQSNQQTLSNPAFRLRADDPTQPSLQPHVTQHYILTVRNPIFEPVAITLATPATTPGRVASRVTILCPTFTLGPAGDVWDEALSSSTSSANDGSRQAAMASLTASSTTSADRQPEAGKIWDKTRNSTSVVLEIVPGSLKSPPSIVPKTEREVAEEELDLDDDVLEVPVFVRAEWEAEVGQHEEVGKREREKGEKGERVKKEVAFWCVLGVGRIAVGG